MPLIANMVKRIGTAHLRRGGRHFSKQVTLRARGAAARGGGGGGQL